MSRRSSLEVLRSTSVSTLVPTGIGETWRCISTLIPDLGHTEVLLSEEPQVLLHSVTDVIGAGPDSWLTWTLSPCNRATRVQLVHSEQVDGAPAELDPLLLILLERCIQTVTTP